MRVTSAEVPALRARLREVCDARVERWEWATADHWALAPSFFERIGRRPGRLLKRPPRQVKAGMCELGRDAEGRVLIKREHTSSGPAEERFEHHGDVVDAYFFFAGQDRCTVTRHWFEDGRLVRLARHYDSGEVCTEVCRWEGERLVGVSSRGGGHDFDDELEHDGRGLRRVIRRWLRPPRAKEQYLRED
jgi:hypothetical protein